MSIPDETYRHNPALAVLVVRKRPTVIWGSLAVAVILTAVFAWIYWGRVTAFEVTGFLMTAWALFVALAIYLAQSAEPSVLAKDLQASKLTLRSQMLGAGADLGTGVDSAAAADKGSPAAQPVREDSAPKENLAAKIEQYKEYIEQLLLEYPKLPMKDITHVDRAPGNARNPTVIVRTRRGHTYSVFHGGRHGNWYITDLTES